MYFADFETTTAAVNPHKSFVWLWGIKGSLDGDKFIWDLGMNSFIAYIFKHKLNNIYFHNLSFDGNFIYKWCFNNGYKYIYTAEDKDYILKDHEWTWICDHRKNIYMMLIRNGKHTIKFYDSYKVLVASVANLGLALGYPKLKMNYDIYYTKRKNVPKNVLKYLERDIDIVMHSFLKFIEIYSKKITAASISYADFVDQYEPNQFADDFGGFKYNFRTKKLYWKNILTENEWKLINRSYQGGYTNSKKTIINKKLTQLNGYYCDVNALYSSVMSQNKMPYGPPIYTKPNGQEDKDYLVLNIIHIKKAIIKDKRYPALFKERSKSLNAKYLHEVTDEERVYWNEEWTFLNKWYNIKATIYKRLYFKCKYVFTEWIEERKNLKINSITTTEKNSHKLILNSLYGKFGQSNMRGVTTFIKDGKPPEKWRKGSMRYGKQGEFTHKSTFIKVDERHHVAVASYICSMARLITQTAIFNNIDIWLYSDTDSCIFSNKPKNMKFHKTKFGFWDLEYKFDIIKILRSKCYMLNTSDGLVKKISGVSQNGKDQINWENFHIGAIIKDGKQSSINVEGGKLIISHDYQLGKKI